MFDMIRVPVVKGRSRDEIEAVARDFLRKYFPKCLRTPQPVPMLKILDRVLPEYLDFSFEVEQLPDGLEGYTHFAGRTVTLSANTYARLEDEDGRGRFTAAHELGHVLLHTDELSRTTSALVSPSSSPRIWLTSRLRRSDRFITRRFVMLLKDEIGHGAVERLDVRDVPELQTSLLTGIVDDQRATAEDPVVEVLLECDVIDPAERDDTTSTGEQPLLLDDSLVGQCVGPCQPLGERQQGAEEHQHHGNSHDDPTPHGVNLAGDLGLDESLEQGDQEQDQEGDEQHLEVGAGRRDGLLTVDHQLARKGHVMDLVTSLRERA